MEIIVVDDASRDETCEVAEAAAATLFLPSEARCIRLSSHAGPAGARNRGWSESCHPWVLFLDADVLLPGRALEWIRETLELYSHWENVAGVLGMYNPKLPFEDFWTNFKNLSTSYLYEVTETRSPYLHTPILCVKKSILEDTGGFDATLPTAEDFRLGLTLGMRGFRFVIDRRIRGTHLKRYSLRAVLREDWRRIGDLGRIPLDRSERRFYYRAHRWNRLVSVMLPVPVVLFSAGAAYEPRAGVLALILLLLFLALNLSFLAYCRRLRGWLFTTQSAASLFLEMLWAQCAAATGVLTKRSSS